MTENEKEKEEAYQAWLKDRGMERFTLVGYGPLIRDQQTGRFYDTTEFLMRYFECPECCNACDHKEKCLDWWHHAI